VSVTTPPAPLPWPAAGKDAAKLDASGRARWRQQALDWLRADLKAWRNAHIGGDSKTNADVARMLLHWQSYPDLAGVRDRAGLGKLPEAERQRLTHWRAEADLAAVRYKATLDKLPEAEREAWRKPWAQVDGLLKRVRDKK
jgi:hypothetical protein